MTNNELALDELFKDWIHAEAIAHQLLARPAPHAAPRCELHDVRLDAPCEGCQALVCGECAGASGTALCGACDELAYQAERARHARKANLLGIGAGVAIFGAAVAVFLLR